jgi:serine/threonine protein kinase
MIKRNLKNQRQQQFKNGGSNYVMIWTQCLILLLEVYALLIICICVEVKLYDKYAGNKGAGRTPMDWETRVKIALGAARGMAYLHAEAGGKFIHGNIKSSNILISQEQSACVTEFGIAQLMAPPQIHPRLIGYRAPEVLETKKPTQKSDVYSFGVLLLEMLTGKAPLRSPGREDYIEHLPRWVQSVVREEWTSEVFDVDLLKHPNIEDEMVQMLQVAMACVAVLPDQRPRMEEVVSRIEEIRNSYSETRTSPEDKP